MNTTPPTVLLDHYLKQLKLPTILREYESIAAVCTRENQDHLAFLLRLVERELIEREQRAAERRIKSARFPVLKTLDTFQFEAQPSINRPLVLELARGEYLDKQESILLMGNPGPGKPTWPPLWARRPACRGNECASFRSPLW